MDTPKLDERIDSALGRLPVWDPPSGFGALTAAWAADAVHAAPPPLTVWSANLSGAIALGCLVTATVYLVLQAAVSNTPVIEGWIVSGGAVWISTGLALLFAAWSCRNVELFASRPW